MKPQESLTSTTAKSVGPKWPPQIALLLDEHARVLNINRSLAGNFFAAIQPSDKTVHAMLHPICEGRCRFNTLWGKAWECLRTRDAVEWEVDDAELGRLLRLQLSRPPSPNSVPLERRKGQVLLTMTDITRHRREHESLVERQEALVRLLLSQAERGDDRSAIVFDDTGDTGQRLMAEISRDHRSLGRQLILAQEDERQRVALELHDGLAQMVGGLKFKFETSVALLGRLHPELDLKDLRDSVSDIRELEAEIRRISRNLAPAMLEDFGIQVALEWLCKDFANRFGGISAACESRVDEGSLPEVVKIAIYRIVQEALNNAAKHSAATRVNVRLVQSAAELCLTVSDDGEGFCERQGRIDCDESSGLGLRSMRERSEATGGTCMIESRVGEGVTVSVTWPIEELDAIR